MSIRRLYSLPTCTLILDGWSENSTGAGLLEIRPVLSILANAECHLMGHLPLSGGREFFESLVTAVSHYAQSLLSGIRIPESLEKAPHLVQLEQINLSCHRLTVHTPPPDAPTHTLDGTIEPQHSGGQALQVDLTTVQLFDLIEAIDQFFADAQTLPGLNLRLEPVPRRYVKAAVPLAERATPAAIGVSSVAIAATLLFFLPVPEVKRPAAEPANSSDASEETSSSRTLSASANQPTTSASPSPPAVSSLAENLNQTPVISDPAQIETLNQQLFQQVNQAWTNREQTSQDLVYRVSVSQDGEIVGYKPANAEASTRNDQENPLFDLLYRPTEGNTTLNEPIAEFRLVFTARGDLQVSPWEGWRETASTSQNQLEIKDAATLEALHKLLYDQLWTNWENKPTFEEALVYRVSINQSGAIASYDFQNQPASDFVSETPLDALQQAGSKMISGTEPLAQFKVVFKPSGVLEISPWHGYQ